MGSEKLKMNSIIYEKSNTIKVVYVPHNIGTVLISCLVDAGYKDNCGARNLVHLSEHVACEHLYNIINSYFKDDGSVSKQLNAYSTFDYSCFWIRTINNNIERLCQSFVDFINSISIISSLKESVIEEEKEKVIQEMNNKKEYSLLMNSLDTIRARLFNLPLTSTKNGMDDIFAKDIINYLTKYTVFQIVIVGSMNKQQIASLVKIFEGVQIRSLSKKENIVFEIKEEKFVFGDYICKGKLIKPSIDVSDRIYSDMCLRIINQKIKMENHTNQIVLKNHKNNSMLFSFISCDTSAFGKKPYFNITRSNVEVLYKTLVLSLLTYLESADGILSQVHKNMYYYNKTNTDIPELVKLYDEFDYVSFVNKMKQISSFI